MKKPEVLRYKSREPLLGKKLSDDKVWCYIRHVNYNWVDKRVPKAIKEAKKVRLTYLRNKFKSWRCPSLLKKTGYSLYFDQILQEDWKQQQNSQW